MSNRAAAKCRPSPSCAVDFDRRLRENSSASAAIVWSAVTPSPIALVNNCALAASPSPSHSNWMTCSLPHSLSPSIRLPSRRFFTQNVQIPYRVYCVAGCAPARPPTLTTCQCSRGFTLCVTEKLLDSVELAVCYAGLHKKACTELRGWANIIPYSSREGCESRNYSGPILGT